MSSSITQDGNDHNGPIPQKPMATPADDTLSLKPPAALYPRSMRAKKTRVLVLGAGMSGLACARELRQRGYQVLVVEARDRLGGRLKGGVKTNDKEGGNEGMKTLPNSDVSLSNTVLKPTYTPRGQQRKRKETTTAVDLGGALIHGIDDNPIYSITQKMGIPTCPVSDCLLFNGSGWPVDTREDERIATMFNECLEETFQRVTAKGLIDPPLSVPASSEALKVEDNSSIPQAVSAAPGNSTTAATTTSNPAAQAAPPETRPPQEENEKHDSAAASPPTLSEDKPAEITGEELQHSKPAAQKTVGDMGVGTIGRSEPDNPTSGVSEALDESATFGDVFDQVCAEKGVPASYPLFQWHQANLEVGCGASFPGLGFKWNDDEPYGFDGAHCAVKTSWKPVVEGLAEGIDILYQSPVKQVVMVVPDPPPEPPEPVIVADLPRQPDLPQPGLLPAVSSPGVKSKRRKAPPKSPLITPLPSRKSRRIRGDDAEARRSSRANKGQKVDRFLVTEFSNNTYDASQQPVRRKKKDEEPEEAESNHTTVQVTLEDGTVLEAEAVVCTLPLGVLKLEPEKSKKQDEPDELEEPSGGGIRFYPPLSERKQNAIQRLGCGLLNKVVLSFSHVFWQDSDFLGLAHPAKSYLVLNAATFTNKPILTFMYGGTFAKEIESWTDNEIVADCMEVIRIICGKRDIPKPLDYVVTRWGNERYSRMSFSYVPPGVDGTQEYKAMSEAVYDPLVPKKPVIMFAGEHTTPFHPSTIHGAFLSGIREAYRLDLIMEAEANNHLEFDDDHTYQYTFWVRQMFHSVTSPSAKATRPRTIAPKATPIQEQGDAAKQVKSRHQHRRRGAATVMNLRERPGTDIPTPDEDPKSTRKKRQLQPRASGQNRGPSGSPAKRSRRSVHAMQNQKVLDEKSNLIPLGGSPPGALKKSPTTEAEALAEKKQLASLESRTLVRALESYGHNYPYISELVLPIFGSEDASPKTLPQVRARCQQLIRSIMTSASASIPNNRLSSWIAKDVFKPPPPGQKPKPPRKRRLPAPPKPRVEGSRKSSRHQKQRHVMDL